MCVTGGSTPRLGNGIPTEANGARAQSTHGRIFASVTNNVSRDPRASPAVTS